MIAVRPLPGFSEKCVVEKTSVERSQSRTGNSIVRGILQVSISQFDNKKPEEFMSEFGHFDVANSYQTSHFKGPNMVDLDFVHKKLLDGHKHCNTTLSLTQ